MWGRTTTAIHLAYRKSVQNDKSFMSNVVKCCGFRKGSKNVGHVFFIIRYNTIVQEEDSIYQYF